jgi:hypothetical protein
MKLNSLYIKSFRGATKPLTLEFDPSKKITMLFGENGNGKSTIADALVCLCTVNRGSLEDKSSTDMSFLKSIGTNSGETKISLTTDTEIYTASMSGSAKSFTKSPSAGQPSLKFLRRSQIISLIDSKPSERYTALKDYIDTGNIDKSEEALRKLQRDTDKDYDLSVKTLESSISTLEKAWDQESKPGETMMDWAKSESEKDITKEKTDYATLSDLISQWNTLKSKQGEIVTHQVKLKELSEAKESLKNEVNALEKESKANASQLLRVLEEAKTYITGQPSISKCPVCENQIDKDSVIQSISGQIQSMSKLQKFTKELETANNIYSANQSVLNNSLEAISKLIIRYKESIGVYANRISEIQPFVNAINTNSTNNYQLYLANIETLSALNIKINQSAVTKNKTIEQHKLISTQYKSITDNLTKSEKLEALKNSIDKAVPIVEILRKEFIDNELQSISLEVEQMYQKIHPNEGLGGIRLFLNPRFQGSLELEAKFHTERGITPQSLYSESHLDTLGICIFLALAKKYSEGNTILILDDVVMSVDENHLDRFIELIHVEVEYFGHIIITTHYRPWKDRYRTHRAPGGKVQFIELRTWSRETGIRIQNGRVELEELELAINDATYFDRQVIASKSGILLENLLDYLSDIYEYHLPKRKSQKYTLGELIDALQPKYLKHIKTVHLVEMEQNGAKQIKELEYQVQPFIDELKGLLFIRNQVGAHFNLAEDANDKDVELFGRKTLELGKALVCPVTGQLPSTKKVDHWKTTSGNIKLYPHEKVA